MTKTEDITIRINLEDYRRCKRILRPYPNESVANYFNRLVNKLEELKNENKT